MDIFNEYIVQRKKRGKDYLAVIGMFIGALILIFTALSFAGYLQSFFLFVVAGIIYLLYIGITSYSVEYEYSVTNGDVDIDKITARRKRKRLISVHSRTFEYFAPLTDEHKKAYEDSSIVQRIDATSNTGSERVCFAVFYKNNRKICLSFEPTDKMIEDFSRNVPRRVFFTR